MSKELARRAGYLITAGCIACHIDGNNGTPAEIHHCKGYEFSGMSLKAKSEHTIGLCYQHHRGPCGYHKSPNTFTRRYGTQRELLDMTNNLLSEMGYE